MIMEVHCLLFFIIRVVHSGYVSVPQIRCISGDYGYGGSLSPILHNSARSVYHRSSVFQATMIMEVFCLLFFIIRVVHSGYVSVPQIFWKDTKNIMVIGIIVVSKMMNPLSKVKVVKITSTQ